MGATENAGPENAGLSKMQGVENTGLENAGPSYGAGKRETSCYGTPKQQKDKACIAE